MSRVLEALGAHPLASERVFATPISFVSPVQTAFSALQAEMTHQILQLRALLPNLYSHGRDEGDDDDDKGMTEIKETINEMWSGEKKERFDEQDIGGFTCCYLNGSFFMDVHPPFVKMLLSLVAYLLSFVGKLNFAFRKLYARNVTFIGMRMFVAA
ncbi:Protein O-mannosyl-transferase 1 [Entomortierella chlamydospora]|uniref:Protein O-mannosyl-transferase 1 n=1 Tax=Entomortierella chlamydospora TaxID=101097 RepID=A0A9P6T0Q7_9FUNG|nr:Protein O-mannosyl-transferase 1 [Entomortierella chlamydospora]KAG0016261.1 Protein O-mannosyl-transferase 1 [Entomortierella chlamydospora]